MVGTQQLKMKQNQTATSLLSLMTRKNGRKSVVIHSQTTKLKKKSQNIDMRRILQSEKQKIQDVKIRQKVAENEPKQTIADHRQSSGAQPWLKLENRGSVASKSDFEELLDQKRHTNSKKVKRVNEQDRNNDYLYLSSGSDDESVLLKNAAKLRLSQSHKMLDLMTTPDHDALKKFRKWNKNRGRNDSESRQMATRVLARLAANTKVDTKLSAFRAQHFK